MRLVSKKWSEYTQVLGVPQDAGFSEIQCAYRRLVLSCHPDVNKTKDAPERFRLIVDAYTGLIEMLKEENVLSGRDIMSRMEADPAMEQLTADELRERFRYSTSRSMRASAVLAMGLKTPALDKELFKEALGDGEDQVRVAALRSLERAGRLSHLAWFLSRPSCATETASRKYAWRAVRSILGRTALGAAVGGLTHSLRTAVFGERDEGNESVGTGGVRAESRT